MSKRMGYGMLLLVVLAVILAGCTAAVRAAGPTTAAVTQNDSPRIISVTGNGSATAAPDVAYVTLGVESVNADAAKAVDDSTTRMQAVMTALQGMGIAAKDVQTVNYAMWLEQSPKPTLQPGVTTNEAQVPDQYHVTNQVKVTVRDLSKVGDLLGAALKAGANSVQGITFGIEDTAKLQEQARQEAIADAQAKADQLAAGFGAKVGAVYSVSEWSGPQPVTNTAMRSLADMGGGAVPISSGELTVNVQIQVQFEIAE